MSDDDKGGLPAVAVNLAALRKKANQALDDCEFYSGGTGPKLEVLAMHGEAALSMIPTILAEFRSAIARAEAAEAQVERLEAALTRIAQWADAYPFDVFPEPNLVQARALLEAGGMTLDSISASAMRSCLNGTGRIARAALAGKEPADG